MNNINLFYEVKNLMNTSREAFETYSNIMCRKRVGDKFILYVCTSKQEAERYFRKTLNKIGSDIVFDITKREIKTKKQIIRFTDITEFINIRDGIRYEEIRLLG